MGKFDHIVNKSSGITVVPSIVGAGPGLLLDSGPLELSVDVPDEAGAEKHVGGAENSCPAGENAVGSTYAGAIYCCCCCCCCI